VLEDLLVSVKGPVSFLGRFVHPLDREREGGSIESKRDTEKNRENGGAGAKETVMEQRGRQRYRAIERERKRCREREREGDTKTNRSSRIQGPVSFLGRFHLMPPHPLRLRFGHADCLGACREKGSYHVVSVLPRPRKRESEREIVRERGMVTGRYKHRETERET